LRAQNPKIERKGEKIEENLKAVKVGSNVEKGQIVVLEKILLCERRTRKPETPAGRRSFPLRWVREPSDKLVKFVRRNQLRKFDIHWIVRGTEKVRR
jgi:hypothetical protein